MAWNPFCALVLSGAGLALSLSAARRVRVFKTCLPAWLSFLTIGLAIGLAAGAALMQWLGYRW